MDKKVTAMTTIITPQITPYRRQNGVTLPWRIPEMALLQKSLCNGLFSTETLLRLCEDNSAPLMPKNSSTVKVKKNS